MQRVEDPVLSLLWLGLLLCVGSIPGPGTSMSQANQKEKKGKIFVSSLIKLTKTCWQNLPFLTNESFCQKKKKNQLYLKVMSPIPSSYPCKYIQISAIKLPLLNETLSIHQPIVLKCKDIVSLHYLLILSLSLIWKIWKRHLNRGITTDFK